MNTLETIYNKLNLVEKTELETHKVELALGDDTASFISKIKKAESKLNDELNNAFTPIRQLEKTINKLASEIPENIKNLKLYTDSLMNLESYYSKELDKFRKVEKEYGEKLPFPKGLNLAVKKLKEFQKMEEVFRSEINEFNTESKKFKKLKNIGSY